MACGLQHTVLLLEGDAVAFGQQASGQCEVPELPEGRRYVAASAGIQHTLLLRDDGQVVAFGGQKEGQCAVPELPEGLRYVQVAAGYNFSIVIRCG